MKKRIVLCLLVLALLSVAGCAQKKDAEPLTVTLWHVYGGEVDSPLNDLIKRFNSTVGAEQNILMDYRDYFSEEELAAFIPAFREEGMIGGRQADAALAAFNG